MRTGVVFDRVFVSLDVHMTVGIVFAFFAGAVESIAFDCSTTRALFDVNAFRGHIRTNFIVQHLVVVTFILFAVGPVVELLEHIILVDRRFY